MRAATCRLPQESASWGFVASVKNEDPQGISIQVPLEYFFDLLNSHEIGLVIWLEPMDLHRCGPTIACKADFQWVLCKQCLDAIRFDLSIDQAIIDAALTMLKT